MFLGLETPVSTRPEGKIHQNIGLFVNVVDVLFDQSREGGVPYKQILVVFVGTPITILLTIFGISFFAGVSFGNVLFTLTGVWVVAWFLMTGSQRSTLGMAATSREGALFGMDKEYARQMSQGTLQNFRNPGVVLLILTMSVVLGWAAVAIRWIAL